MKHVMIDLETMGNGPRAAIVAIGACEFDPARVDQGFKSTFYCRVSLAASMAAGLEVDASTVMWWMEQSDATRQSTFSGCAHKVLANAMTEFSAWLLRDQDDEVVAPWDAAIWGNGATFDNVIIRSAYKACGFDAPWSFRNDKCYRTVVNLLPKDQIPFVPYGTAHNALDDAIAQALHLQKVWKALGLPAG